VNFSPILVIAVLLGLGYVLLIAPQRRKARAHIAMQDALEVGDEIITAGGLHAVIREVSNGDLRVEIAPGVIATLDRRAVAAVAEQEPGPEPEQPDEPDAEAEPEPEDSETQHEAS
jgi:preprotein translocase subunit YajC